MLWQRAHALQSFERSDVLVGDRAPAGVPRVEMIELDREHRALESIHAPVEAELGVVVPALLRVIAEANDARGSVGVVGHARATFAPRAEVLSRVEARGVHAANRADALTLVLCTD